MASNRKYQVKEGDKFGRLEIVVARSSTINKVSMCFCKCECGTVKEFALSSIVHGRTKSCGCLAKEVTGNRARTHGLSKSPEYAVWNRMWSRCTNPNVDRYPRYGGRGIKVCDRWSKFELFIEDMGPMPSPNHSIGRRDNDGNYEPSNCRWETEDEQSNNRSTSKFVEWNGARKTYSDWAKETGIPYWTIVQRHRAGMPLEKVFDRSEGGLSKKFIEFNGDRKLTTEWMRDLGIPISSFYHFKRKGLSAEQIIEKYTSKQLETAK